MANYVETIVGPGEQVLYAGKVSLFSILPALIGGTLLIIVGGAFTIGAGPVGLIFALLGLIVIIVALIRRNSTELAVTNRRVIAKFGFIKRNTIDLRQTNLQIGRGWRRYVLRQYVDLSRADDLATAVWRVLVCGMTIHDREWHVLIFAFVIQHTPKHRLNLTQYYGRPHYTPTSRIRYSRTQ